MAQTELSRPLYAVLGASDLLGDHLKKFATHAPHLSQQMQTRAAQLPRELRHRALHLPRDLQILAVGVPSYAAELHHKTRQFDTKAVTTTVRKNVETAQSTARQVFKAYAELVRRGQIAANGSTGKSARTPT